MNDFLLATTVNTGNIAQTKEPTYFTTSSVILEGDKLQVLNSNGADYKIVASGVTRTSGVTTIMADLTPCDDGNGNILCSIFPYEHTASMPSIEQAFGHSDYLGMENVSTEVRYRNISDTVASIADTLTFNTYIAEGETIIIVLADNSQHSTTVTIVGGVMDTTSITNGEVPTRVYAVGNKICCYIGAEYICAPISTITATVIGDYLEGTATYGRTLATVSSRFFRPKVEIPVKNNIIDSLSYDMLNNGLAVDCHREIWNFLAELPEVMSTGCSTVYDGKLFVYNQYTKHFYALDLSTGIYSSLQSGSYSYASEAQRTALFGHAGKVYLQGYDKIYEYDTFTDAWTSGAIATVNSINQYSSCVPVVLDDVVHLQGDSHIYKYSLPDFTSLGSTSANGSGGVHLIKAEDDKFYYHVTNGSNRIYKYDMETGAYVNYKILPFAVNRHGEVHFNDKIYLFNQGTSRRETWIYNTTTGLTTRISDNEKYILYGSICSSGSKVYMVGGKDDTGTSLARTMRFMDMDCNLDI